MKRITLPPHHPTVPLPRARHAAMLLPALICFCHASDARVVYVNRNAAGATHTGAGWSTAFLTVQEGANAAATGDEIWVAKGTYAGHFTLASGLSLYGGFAGTETSRTQRAPQTNGTVLDAGGAGIVLTTGSGTGQADVVDGFTIQHGEGGIAANDAATISNNVFSGNSGPYGGAIYVKAGAGNAVRITGNTITGNTGGASGGLTVESGTATVDHNSVTDNNGGAGGLSINGPGVVTGNFIARNKGQSAGGMAAGAGVAITFNTISANTGVQHGGGIAVYGTATISNNAITGNAAGGGGSAGLGGGVWVNGAADLVNNTIAANTAGSGGGVCVDRGRATLENNVLAFNSSGLFANTSFSTTFDHNDAFGNTAYNFSGVADPAGQNGNIAADPLFKNKAQADYHETAASPTVDQGEDDDATAALTDLDGNTRILGARVDMGAYEFGAPPAKYTLADAASALRVAAGFSTGGGAGYMRLNLENSGDPLLDLRDAARIARKAAGTDPNP